MKTTKRNIGGASRLKLSRTSPSSANRFPVGLPSVLVAVTGMSPAILTETVWALAHEKPALLPDRVIVFGTQKSRDQIRLELFETGVWESLRKTLGASSSQLVFGDTGEHIRVFTRDAKELADIRTPEDNAAAADFILENLRSFTENPDLRVIASIAGGRKTMGALLYAAMTLIGRETDRITHVLVDEILERQQNPKFFFPIRPHQVKGITLADVPFVPLRNRFAELGRMPGGFGTLVRHYTSALRQETLKTEAALRFDDAGLKVFVAGASVQLNCRAYLALRYAVHLNQKKLVPVGLAVDNEAFRAFIAKSGLYPEWSRTADAETDLRHELNVLRRAFDRHGIAWKPGLRRDALRLPPFHLVH